MLFVRKEVNLILGSQSPRRKEILSFFSIPFKQVSPDFDETQIPFQGDPESFCCEVAKRKALTLADRYPNDIILTADTVVFRKNRLFLKPETEEEARGMLKELSGKQHEVYTGVCVLREGKLFIRAEKSVVEFNKLTDAQIHTYHTFFSPLDKAGGYAIQKAGSLIVKRIEGCYYNIMGLPIQTAHALLYMAGVDLWDHLKSV